MRHIMTLQALSLTVFTAVMAAAAFEDFRRLIIPNVLPILLCIGWPVYYLAGTPSLYGAVAAIGCALAVLLVGAVLFARGWLGGGDVKLLSAAALWAGASGTPSLLMFTGIFGGVLALLLMMPFASQAAAATRGMLDQTPEPSARGLSMPVPYGVAIAAAALTSILSPHIG